MIQVGTGEKYFFGLRERTEEVEAGYAVTRTFEVMIEDYRSAYTSFLELMERN